MNRLLWLACRLAGRSVSLDGAGTAGFLVFILGGVIAVPFIAGGTFVTIISQSTAHARELTHLILTAIYVSWLILPLLGYRFDDAMNPSSFLIYPVSSRNLILANLVSGFLDPCMIIVIPGALGVGFAHGGGPWGVLPAMVITVLFVLNTIITGRFLVIVLRCVMSGGQRIALVCVTMVSASLSLVWLLHRVEFGPILPVLNLSSPLDLSFSVVTSVLPSGVAARGLEAFAQGELGGGAYWSSILMLWTLLVAAVGTWISTRIIVGTYSQSAIGADCSITSSNVVTETWLERMVRTLVPHNSLSAAVVKDVRLVLREPQYRLLFSLYVVVVFFMHALLSFDRAAAPAQLFGSVILTLSTPLFFGGYWFNCLALERGALRQTLVYPVRGFHVLLSKSIAMNILLSGMIVLSTFARITIFADSGWGGERYFVWELGAFVVVMLILSGVGNVVSVICPIPLPETGIVQRSAPGFGRVMFLSFLTWLALSVTVVLLTPTIIIPIAAITVGEFWTGRLIVYALLYAIGVWAILTVVSGGVLETRRENIIHELTE